MYEYLEGQVASHSPARLVLDVGGVGYDLLVPLGSGFPSSGRVRAWTHFVVRDDAHLLCGFPDRETRDLFRLLLSVRGVGASMAVGILSGLPREALLQAIVDSDAPRLMRAKGVGKKTAEQILLDLRDKVGAFDLATHESATRTGSPKNARVEDAVKALISIGYAEKEARQNVERAARDVDPEDLERLVRCALAV